MSEVAFDHQISFVTARILIEIEKDKTSVGTGFFCNVELPDLENKSLILLISNKHVFVNPETKISISLNKVDKEDNPIYGDVFSYEINNFSDYYYEHPTEDLACINVSSLSQKEVSYKSISQSFLIDIDYSKIYPGKDVLFVGYPANRYDIANNLPLVRKGYISSFPKLDFNGRGQIVIDAQVYQGSSGSPVFTAYDGTYKLLGVVSETMIRNSRLQTLPTCTEGYNSFQEIIGLGIVIKQKHVKELLQLTVNDYMSRYSSQ